MTTARVRHRDYVPYGWIAIEFCEVEFFGTRARQIEEEWKKICNERYNKYNNLVEALKFKKNKAQQEIDKLSGELKESKPWYRPWHNKTEKDIIKKIDELIENINGLDRSIKRNEDMRFFAQSEKKRNLENLLKRSGFVLTNTAAAGDECVTYTDIWTSER